MKLYLVRHAEVEPEGENPNLSKIGITQSKYLSKRLQKLKFSKFYCSGLNRAIQTSDFVSKLIKVKPKIELSLNEYESSDIKKDEKHWSRKELRRKKKLCRFIDKVTKSRDSDENLLIISHGITNRIIMAHVLDLPLKRLVIFQQHNTCINRLNWSEKFKNWQLEKMNDYEHLPRSVRKKWQKKK
jgi:probable phosphoglycerate mutase